MQKQTLTAAQQAAFTAAVHNFIDQRTIGAGRGAVILLPEFREVNGVWEPVLEGMGCRPVAGKSSTFLRFAKVTLSSTGSNIKKSYVYTNLFGETEQDLVNTLLMVDPTAVIGGVVKNVRLVVHESLVPFSKTNPMRDIKQIGEIICRVEDQPIYRKAQVFFADDYGQYPAKACDILVQHTNTAELSAAASVKWNNARIPVASTNLNTPPTVTKTEAELEAEVAAIEAIPEANRTRVQKKQLKEALAALDAIGA